MEKHAYICNIERKWIALCVLYKNIVQEWGFRQGLRGVYDRFTNMTWGVECGKDYDVKRKKHAYICNIEHKWIALCVLCKNIVQE